MAAGFGYTAGPPGSSGGLTRPTSQPAPAQPGFGTQPQQRPLTQPPASGFGQAGGLGALQQFGQAGGFGNFGGFGQNPQMQQYRQQMQDWRALRPEFQGDMNRDMRQQQMQDWRDLRPDRPNMQQPGMTPGQGMPQYSQYMSQIFGNAQAAQGAQGAPQAQIGMAAPDGVSQQQQQAALLSQYNQMLQGSGQPGILANPATLTPQQIQSMQSALGAVAGAGTPPAPLQAAMPPAPNTQQIGREDPRMQAMRNMQRMRPGFGG